MGVAGVIALVVIFICFPLAVYASFRVVLSADRNEPEHRRDDPRPPDSPDRPESQDDRGEP